MKMDVIRQAVLMHRGGLKETADACSAVDADLYPNV